MTKFWAGLIIACCALSVKAPAAQTRTAVPGPLSLQNTNYVWAQGAMSLTEAQGYTYRAYVDQLPPQVLGASCATTTSTNIYACTAPIGPQLVGTHSVQLTAASGAGESDKSMPALVFTLTVVPAQPQNLTIGAKPADRPTTQTRTFPKKAK